MHPSIPSTAPDTLTAGSVGLALGSGSARGLAHIGVLRALDEAGLAVQAIAGSSIGALIGAIAASGRLGDVEERFLAFDWRAIAGLLDPVFPRSGLIDGHKITEFVRAHVPAARIEDLPIPFRAVTTDLHTGQEVVIASGDLIEAVRASIAVPGIFTPVRSGARVLLDGGLVNPVPVSVVRAMGADTVIAVDLNHDIATRRVRRAAAPKPAGPAVPPPPPAETLAGRGRFQQLGGAVMAERLRALGSPALAQFNAWLRRDTLPGIFDVLLGSIDIMQARITQANLREYPPDLLIQPTLGQVRFMEYDRAGTIIEAGYACARDQLAAWARTRPDRP